MDKVNSRTVRLSEAHCVDYTALKAGDVFDLTDVQCSAYILRRIWSHIGAFRYKRGSCFCDYSIANCFESFRGSTIGGVPETAELVSQNLLYEFYEVRGVGGYVKAPHGVYFYPLVRDRRRLLIPKGSYFMDWGRSVRVSEEADTSLDVEAYKATAFEGGGVNLQKVSAVSADCKRLYPGSRFICVDVKSGKSYVLDNKGYYTEVIPVGEKPRLSRFFCEEAVCDSAL